MSVPSAAAPAQQPDRPAPPLPAGPAPSAARYPLYADTVPSQPPPVGPPPVGPPPVGPPPVGPPHTATASYDVAPSASRRSVVPWLIAVLALAVIALTGGGLLLLAQSGEGDADDRELSGGGDQRNDPAGAPAGATSALTPADVAVPGSAPDSVDEDGDKVTFQADNMLDADPRTSWRMAGDGSGSVVTFTFDDAVTVTEVGLINGYAKTDPPHDWYAGNRRIESVVWVFGDGTEVTQELDEVPDLQTVGVDAVETTTIELRIVEVTEPGVGPDGRDFTAISDVEISGVR